MNRYLYIALALLGGMACGVLWYNRTPPAPTGIHLPAAPAPEVAKIELEPLIVDFPLQAYKPAAKQKLKLPAHVQADAKQHVVASTRTAPDERPHTVTTVLDSGTGAFTTYDRAEPLPWLSVNSQSQVGVFYGIKGGAPILRLQAQQELLQVKALHFGAIGTLDSDTAYFVGVGAWARW